MTVVPMMTVVSRPSLAPPSPAVLRASRPRPGAALRPRRSAGRRGDRSERRPAGRGAGGHRRDVVAVGRPHAAGDGPGRLCSGHVRRRHGDLGDPCAAQRGAPQQVRAASSDGRGRAGAGRRRAGHARVDDRRRGGRPRCRSGRRQLTAAPSRAADLPDSDDEVDLDDLVDAPPETVKTPIDRLAEAFPGSELIDERD